MVDLGKIDFLYPHNGYNPRRGDHVYVWRKIRLYQHHGIVVSSDDILENLPNELKPSDIEPFMVVEQNLHGLGIVSIKNFQLELPINYLHDIGLAVYKTDPMDYYLNRSGTCYLATRLDDDKVVQNAIRAYGDKQQREIWKTYSLVIRNCEQFAFMCCTNVDHVLGEQILLGCNAIKCIFVQSMYNAGRFVFEFIMGLAEQLLTGVSIEMILKANGIAALVAFATEGLILSVRLFIYYYYKEDREKNLARKYAITPELYAQQMIQAGFGSLAAFGTSIGGLIIGSHLFLGAVAPLATSILFGFIGYLAVRWLTGVAFVKAKKKFTSENQTKTTTIIAFINKPGDDDDEVKFITSQN